MVSVENFEKQIDNIEYKNEIYSARDNGAVMRYPKNEKVRQLDNIWTFGKQSTRTGYMEIGGERVHRIVATGFLGNAPSKEHLVDHIDTNRANNRPENLRWVTKFENAVLNPITAKRIAMVCGSVENFLNDPAKYRDMFKDPNVSWMCSVSKEEAKNCLNNLKTWSKLENYEKTKNASNGKLGNWIFKPNYPPREPFLKSPLNDIVYYNNDNDKYYTPNAEQDWSTPTKFPCCPSTISKTPLQDYFNNLCEGAIFGENRYTKYKVVKAALCEDKIVVLTEDEQDNAIKPWCVNRITFSNNIFYHSVVKTCFQDIGAEKRFMIEQGLEWTGEDSIDDYC